ncbi:cytochrome c oxidase subunit III [Leptothrix cholodnii SP-6]|uniref:Cytochrome c oxidase subunit III n=1 Tax=Leptothrix cholodnii (strain ATCC 51168 / LMG 8142 / SP-6) TaxID=395495 RepID=B1Y7S9_LEPCP|nr:cytochrome c oxidase subunit 3 [Leptothrix cholodnii]ACB32527.1 cytochrome c oxidase subunit III [Leptothrix cholodnii SP-6]
MSRIVIPASATHPRASAPAPQRPHPTPLHADNVSVGLWLLMAVIGVLFALFALAYVMRMAQGDASSIALPWLLWPSTALLLAASVAMQSARRAVRRAQHRPARQRLLAAAALACGFLVTQFGAWQALADAAVTPAGNPAASFFYLLTALHGLHVAGGLVAWEHSWRAITQGRQDEPDGDLRASAWRVALCARYWHFLLLVWLGLLGLLGGVTPELARAICGV